MHKACPTMIKIWYALSLYVLSIIYLGAIISIVWHIYNDIYQGALSNMRRVLYDNRYLWWSFDTMLHLINIATLYVSAFLNQHNLKHLAHCGLVMPYGNKLLGQLWLRQWLVALQHQAITWRNIESSSVTFNDISLIAISWDLTQQSIITISMKYICLKCPINLSGINELIVHDYI